MPTACRGSPRRTMTTPPSGSALPMPRTGCFRWNCSAATPPGGWPRSLGRKRRRSTNRCGCSVCTAPPNPRSPYLSPAVNRAFQAYAAGVNAFLASRRGALPPEFLLLHFRPEPWREADSLVWGKLMAFQLDGNYRGELLRARMARSISPADLAFLYPRISQRRADHAGYDVADLPPAGARPDL